MNDTQEEIDAAREEARNDRTARGATGKRLAFTMPAAPFESQIKGVASDEERARMEDDKAEAARIIAEREAQQVVKRFQFRPKGDRVLVVPLVTPEKRNGVIIAETARYLTAEGKVVAVGPGPLRPDGSRVPLETRVGDIVKYTPYTGSAFRLNDVDVLVLREGDLLGDIIDDD